MTLRGYFRAISCGVGWHSSCRSWWCLQTSDLPLGSHWVFIFTQHCLCFRQCKALCGGRRFAPLKVGDGRAFLAPGKPALWKEKRGQSLCGHCQDLPWEQLSLSSPPPLSQADKRGAFLEGGNQTQPWAALSREQTPLCAVGSSSMATHLGLGCSRAAGVLYEQEACPHSVPKRISQYLEGSVALRAPLPPGGQLGRE